MDFKKEIRDAIEKAGSPAKLSEESFINYSKNYSVIKSSDSIRSLIQGKVYTFYYDSDIRAERGFINRRPVIFLDSREITPTKSIIKGLDLILITPIDRINFFIRLHSIYGKIMDQNEGKEKSSQMPLRFDPQLLETLMGGIKYNHAYTGYKMEKIKGLKEIPRDEWKHLVYLNTKSIEGATINDIYNKYR
jgi:hypothetical protein